MEIRALGELFSLSFGHTSRANTGSEFSTPGHPDRVSFDGVNCCFLVCVETDSETKAPVVEIGCKEMPDAYQLDDPEAEVEELTRVTKPGG